MIKTMITRLYALADAFSITGNDAVSDNISHICEVLDKEVNQLEKECIDKENGLNWSKLMPTRSGFYVWKELGVADNEINRDIARIKVGKDDDLYINFNKITNFEYEYTKLSKISAREWIRVAE